MPDKLTDAELAALSRLEQAATPAPWMANDGLRDSPGGFMYDVLCGARAEDWRVLLQFNHNFPERVPADRELVAAMRNALPSMLRELAVLREQVAAEREKRAALVREWRAVRWDGLRTVGLRDAADQLAALDKPEGA